MTSSNETASSASSVVSSLPFIAGVAGGGGLLCLLCLLFSVLCIRRHRRNSQLDMSGVQPSPSLTAFPVADNKTGLPVHRLSSASTVADQLPEADLSSSPVHLHVEPEAVHIAVGATVVGTMRTMRAPGLGAPLGLEEADDAAAESGGSSSNPLALPAVWKMYRDGNGRRFYYNTVTGASEWTLPVGATLQTVGDRM